MCVCIVICFGVEQAFTLKVATLRKGVGVLKKEKQNNSNKEKTQTNTNKQTKVPATTKKPTPKNLSRERVKAICLKALCKTYTQCWGNKPIMCASQEVGD